MILDTSFIIDLMNGEDEALAELGEIEEGNEPQKITTVTLFELWSGIEQSSIPEEEKEKVLDVISSRIIHDLDTESAKKAGRIDRKLMNSREKIDPEDSLISGIALQREERILTGNTKHFNKVEEIEDLKVESYR